MRDSDIISPKPTAVQPTADLAGRVEVKVKYMSVADDLASSWERTEIQKSMSGVGFGLQYWIG